MELRGIRYITVWYLLIINPPVLCRLMAPSSGHQSALQRSEEEQVRFHSVELCFCFCLMMINDCWCTTQIIKMKCKKSEKMQQVDRNRKLNWTFKFWTFSCGILLFLLQWCRNHSDPLLRWASVIFTNRLPQNTPLQVKINEYYQTRFMGEERGTSSAV